jgi:hypothetical protein
MHAAKPWYALGSLQSFEGEDGLKLVVSHLKQQYGVQYVYAWHAMMGFWGGVAPDCEGTAKYHPRLVFPKPTRSLLVRERQARERGRVCRSLFTLAWVARQSSARLSYPGGH